MKNTWQLQVLLFSLSKMLKYPWSMKGKSIVLLKNLNKNLNKKLILE